MGGRGVEASARCHLILIVVVAVCVLVAVGDWIYGNSKDAFAAFIGTMFATFAGVGAAAYINVRRFYAESEENDRVRSQLLAQSLAGELSTVRDILKAQPNFIVPDPSGTNHILVRQAQLEPTATEEAIRVGLLGTQSSANLSQISNFMRDYSRASDNLYPLVSRMRMASERTAPRISAAAYPLALEIDRLRLNLLIWCDAVLTGLAAQGVPIPEDPTFRTNPQTVVTYRPGPPADPPLR